MKKSTKGTIILLIVCLVVMGASFYVSRNYLVVFPVSGESMENTLYNKENMLLFRTKKLKHGDVFVFWFPTTDSYLVKRVIGLENDLIEIKYNNEEEYFEVYRNGERLNEEYIKEPITDSSYAEYSVEVPSGKIFFLGDNRNHSNDSHYGHFAEVENVQGKVFLKYLNWNISFL